MSSNAKKTGGTGPFDVKTVEALVALMKENELNEIYLRDGNQQVRLRRGALAAPVAVPIQAVAPASAPITPKSPPTTAETPAAPKKNLHEIKSETVGTFYAQPKPGEPAFVKLGDRVTPNKVVGLVEVMKTYNEIQANCTGVIAEVLVESGKYVEFGEVLFRVDPS